MGLTLGHVYQNVVAGDELDIELIDNSGNELWVYLDFNRNSTFVLGVPRIYMNVATYSIVGGSFADNIKQRQAPVLIDLADEGGLRYRMRRLPASDELDNSTMMPTNTPVNVWSAWRGGITAPTQNDRNFYHFFANETGTKTGRFEYELEQPDGTGTIISTLVITLRVTKLS